MLDNLSYEEFAEQVNTEFQVEESDIKLSFTQISAKRELPNQLMFSMTFGGPLEHFLEQKIYKLTHEKLGSGELFIVPIAQNSDGYIYEIAFNRLIKN